MITKNAEQFKNFLEAKNITLDFMEGAEGDTIVEVVENLESGGKMRIVVIFNANNSMVSILGTDFITGINPVKKATYMKH